jgi:homogentisate 1,2-dioxygenase
MSRKWFTLPQHQGTVSRQAHAKIPADTYEREIGREGFFGPATHMYHTHAPTSWSKFEGALRPRAFDTNKSETATGSPWDAPALLGNAHTKLRVWQCDRKMTRLARNSDGDDLLFVHAGAGALFCDYGHLTYRDGDYIMIPRGAMWRLEPSQSTRLLLIEATNAAYMQPERGLLGDHAFYDTGVLDVPLLDDAFRAQQGEQPWQVAVKRHGAVSTISYPFNPLDCVGWKGHVSVLRLNWRDIRPIISDRMHLAPTVHTTFVGNRFVICTFCPRPVEGDPEALKLPFYHNNDDYDEVIFYHAGNFISRDNIKPGMITLHPSGITHGPHPKAFAAAAKAERKQTDEVAVMLDTRDALEVYPDATAVEWTGYVDSWS